MTFARMTALFCFLGLSLLIAAPVESPAREISSDLHKITLPNGLAAIVKESHRAPVVAVQVWVKAGSAYETDEEAGITHLVEHMIFKGTEKRGAGEIAREIESVGGSINAYTSFDVTVYHCVVPRQFLDTALDVLSDAVFHSTFDPEELELEKKVVLEEIRMREDRPEPKLYRILRETAYTVHPYRRPIIGYPETVKSFKQADIKAYMARRYRPGHMSVIVSGDVEASRALARVQEVFGAAPPEKVPEQTPEPRQPEEPAQESARLHAETMEIHEAHLAVAFTGLPSFNSPEVPALDVLAELLGSGESSRLTLSLRSRLQLVHRITADAFTPAGPGLFEVTASLEPEKTQETLSQIFREVFRLQNEEVLEEELERAKIKVETRFVYAQETMEGEARELGVFETLANDPYAVKLYLEKVRKISAQDIQRVACQVFRRDNVNVAMIMPGDRPSKLTLQEMGIIAQEAELQAQGIMSSDAGALVHPVRRTNLANGLTILVQEAPEVPTVAFRLVFPGGVRYETEETSGLFNFLARAWTKGTEAHSAQGLAELIEGMGATISGFSGSNTFGLEGRFLSQTLDKGLAVFTELVLTPTFPQEEVDKLRPLLLAQLKSQEDNIPKVAVREFRRLFFSPHPYGMDPLGSAPAIQGITSQQLLSAYKDYALPDRAVLSVVGDVRTEQIITDLETLLGGWFQQSESAAASPPPPPEALSAPRFLNLKREKQQVHIVLGFPGVSFNSPDRYALEVLNAVLSGQGGRLFASLRDEKGLAYSVTSFVGLGLDYGSFAFYVACAPEKKDTALKELWREIYRVIDEPVPAKELERAKRWLIGNYEIGLQTHGAKAMDMALNELYGLGFNFASRYVQEIGKVDAEQVLALAKRTMVPEQYVLVRVGP
jgi:zinc protease